MRQLLILFFSLLAYSSWAQLDTPNRVELGIRPKEDENDIQIKPIVKDKTPSLSDFQGSTLPDSQFSTTQGKSIFEKPKFQTPNEGVADRINKSFRSEGDADSENYKRNQYFGDFKTDSKYIKLVYRDHIAFDGDRVMIRLNGQTLYKDLLLESQYKHVAIDLEIGFNKIEIVALNQGTSGPNTAEFQVYNDKGELISSNQWELATGYFGTIILTKEQ